MTVFQNTQIALAVNAKTMSSKQIADVVNSRHDSVKRTIDTLAEKGVIQLPQTVEVKNHLGQTVTEYQVNERDSYGIVHELKKSGFPIVCNDAVGFGNYAVWQWSEATNVIDQLIQAKSSAFLAMAA